MDMSIKTNIFRLIKDKGESILETKNQNELLRYYWGLYGKNIPYPSIHRMAQMMRNELVYNKKK